MTQQQQLNSDELLKLAIERAEQARREGRLSSVTQELHRLQRNRTHDDH